MPTSPPGNLVERISRGIEQQESRHWTLEEPHRTQIAQDLAWAAENPPAETDLDALAERALSPASESGGAANE